MTLRDDLQMRSKIDRYWEVRNHLIDLAFLERCGGKGGSVRLTEEARPSSYVEYVPRPERELYEPMCCVLRANWTKEEEFSDAVAAVTADQGSRTTGGRWTRPDILVVGVRRYAVLPQVDVEAVTFEVKTFEGANVTAVYEALAHRRRAHRAYVLVHRPTSLGTVPRLEPIEQAARGHGIGLILTDDPHDFGQWETRLPAVHVEPHPHVLDSFLHQQLPPDDEAQLRKMAARHGYLARRAAGGHRRRPHGHSVLRLGVLRR
ncbi:MAG: hypothetical protein GEV08_15660 [Acidimicrobiia bacterium]|nr:hypothetical protein [Acidimicrobiia bacterium]